jgi:hypothetical protein
MLLESYALVARSGNTQADSLEQLRGWIQQFFRDDGRPQDADTFFASVDTQAAASRER